MSKIRAGKHTTRKEVIVKKAASLFMQKGFASSSMRELADMLGVEAPSLYNHIGSKGELLQAICYDVANRFNQHLAHVKSGKESASKKVETIIRFHIQMMLNDFDGVYVANHEWKQLQEPFLSNFLHQRKTYENTLAEIIEEGINRKELRKINPHIAVLTILSAVRGMESWLRHKRNISAEEFENNMITHLLSGLNK